MIEDPRIPKAIKNLESPRSVYLVVSSKGGVGKTTTSTLLALVSSIERHSTGLLDLDFVNPSTHIILGLDPRVIKYEEEKGVKPYMVLDNLYYFTIVPYTMDNPIALRGGDASNALWEILAIVRWNDIENLYIDTPPGIGDEHLDILYRLRRIVKPIVVATPSRLALRSIDRLVDILREMGYGEILFIENMGNGLLRSYAIEKKLIYAGFIPYINEIEESIGSIEKLLKSDLLSYVKTIYKNLRGFTRG